MPKSTSRFTGLRKFVPQPNRYAERYGNFTLTARDLQILEAVYRYRYLEARHIRALVAGSNHQITRRLQGLFHNKYVGRYARRERMRMELDPGAPLMAYGLELKGARALERSRDRLAIKTRRKPAPVMWRKDYTRRTEWFLEHHLMVSNFRCALELALRETADSELVTWDQSKEIWFRVRIPGERTRSIRVAPDAYFALRVGDQTRHFFLEADRSTEEHGRLTRKFHAYWWYLQSQAYRDNRSGAQRVAVLFSVTGERRRLNIMDTLRHMSRPNRATHGGRGMFWFTCESEYTSGCPAAILGPIWRVTAANRGSRSII